MQVYTRIANPYMPQGLPNLTNAPTPLYAPGELGCVFNDQSTGNTCLRVKLDSGATASTPIGVVAAGQLAFWKDTSQALVTNDCRMADVCTPGGAADSGPLAAINRVAGIFQLAVTAAPGVNGTDGQPIQYVCDLIVNGTNVNVATKAASALAGAQATVDSSVTGSGSAKILTAGGQLLYTTGVNTAPLSKVIGLFKSNTVTSSQAPVDVAIGFSLV